MWSKLWQNRSVSALSDTTRSLKALHYRGFRYFVKITKSFYNNDPNQARYHLRYTRIFSFCYYTTAQAKIKDFPVCGHSCGQGRFSAWFGNPEKSRKPPCCRALWPPGFRVVDGAGATPKSSAIPPSLHPDIQFLLLYHAAGENQRFSCLWSFLWSRPLFGPVSSSGKTAQMTAFQNLVAFGVSGRG